MAAIITNLNVAKTLLNPITVNGQTITEIQVSDLIIRPVLKRIVFTVSEINKVIVYEGDTDFEAHKDDSQEALLTALLAKIDNDYKA